MKIGRLACSRAASLEGRPTTQSGVDTPLVRAAMEQSAEDLPLGETFRAAAADGRLADPVATAQEIWELIERGVEPGDAVAVGAVPSAPI